jgi:hypothetical protein
MSLQVYRIAHRNGHQLFNILDLVAICLPQPFKFRFDLGLRKQTLLRGLAVRGLSSENNVVVVVIEKSTFVVNRPRSDFHLQSMLLSIPLDVLQMLVIAILGEPANDVFRGPIDGQAVRVLIKDMVLVEDMRMESC